MNRADPGSGVLLLRHEIEYQDGSEHELLTLMQSTADRSVYSNELKRAIRDWPTRYHLSSARSNLLRPFPWSAELRVLEVGGGCGALTRFLGEAGPRVDTVEGSLARAKIIAARCADLPNVTVTAGRIEDFKPDARYDVVVVVGVLEYAGRFGSTPTAAHDLLRLLTEQMTPDGMLLLAIENQLGLQYLAGYREDHLGEPFVGLEDYGSAEGIRTYPRRELAEMLDHVDLAAQSWLYPFPDYKLPSVILTHTAASDPALNQFCQHLVRAPIADFAQPMLWLYDARLALRVWARAGLLPEVANSFLVVAARTARSLERFAARDVLAYSFKDPSRLNVWVQHERFRQTEGGPIQVEPLPSASQLAPQRAWLSRGEMLPRPMVHGTVLRDTIVAACRGGDVSDLELTLGRWRSWLLAYEAPEDFRPRPGRNPFAANFGPSRILPAHLLDANLDNFIETAQGEIHYFDWEWEADGGVFVDAVCLRALWYLARELICSGVRLPWSPTLSVAELAATLCKIADVPYSNEMITKDFLPAEAELQHLVTDEDTAKLAEMLQDQNRMRRDAFPILSTAAFSSLRAQVAEYSRVDVGRAADLVTTQARSAELEAELEAARGRGRELEAERATDLATTGARSAALEAELEAARGRVGELEAERAADLVTTGARTAELEAELEAARCRAGELEAELEAARYRSAALEAELEAAGANLARLQEHIVAVESGRLMRLLGQLHRLLGH